MKIKFCLSALFLTLVAFILPALSAGQSPVMVTRVVSLSPIITETIYLLGAQDRLVANTHYCNVPPDAAKKEKIGSVTQVNVEKIISLSPDLVITSALTREKQIQVLKNQGINIMEIENPKTFDQMCAITREIGQALGREREAVAIVAAAQTQVKQIRERVSCFSPRRVFIQIGLKPLHTVNKDLFINEFILLSNGVNIAQDQPSGIYSREMVIRENPDVILIATMGTSKKAGFLEKERWMKFSSLRAGVNNEIHVLDPEMICSPTPASFAMGLAQVASLIHPEAGHDQ
ncbi:MAG: ABC transporter substrate-binding protein [Desulfobacter sp.]|nr:ABC transporter substrate-binding protein [Desulfobacter sp.]WDP84828.1 MAG: ABC transporter substrate-binding protein [Desulfobacter sp.]